MVIESSLPKKQRTLLICLTKESWHLRGQGTITLCPCLLCGRLSTADLPSLPHHAGFWSHLPLTRSITKISRISSTNTANTALGSDPITGTGSTGQLVGFHLRNTSSMDHYSCNQSRKDGWLSWPCWLNDSGRLTHKVVTRPAVSLAQDRESLSARTGVLTTMLRNHLVFLA